MFRGPDIRRDSDVLRCVLRILGSRGIGDHRVERRRDERFPFPYVMYLTPTSDQPPTDLPRCSIVVVGKHISKHGLDFYHHDPLPYRHVIAAVEEANHHWIRLSMDITWCRFIRQGWYASGGKFLGVVKDDLAPEHQESAVETVDGAALEPDVDEARDLVLATSEDVAV